jgi:hypothetical protein
MIGVARSAAARVAGSERLRSRSCTGSMHRRMQCSGSSKTTTHLVIRFIIATITAPPYEIPADTQAVSRLNLQPQQGRPPRCWTLCPCTHVAQLCRCCDCVAYLLGSWKLAPCSHSRTLCVLVAARALPSEAVRWSPPKIINHSSGNGL